MPLGAASAGPGLLCGLFIYLCGWGLFSCTITSGPLCCLWLSACSCRPSTEEIINTILAVIVANSTAGGSRPVPLPAFLSPPLANNSHNVTLRTMNASENTQQSISQGFRSCLQPGEARETFATPSGSPTRFGKGGFGEGKGVWEKLTKGLATGHRPHCGSHPR